jgi:hypothetical protein
MADATGAAFSNGNAAPFIVGGRRIVAMIELLFVAQTFRNPIQALMRRWYCYSLFRATRGARRCKDCTAS